MAKLLRCWRKSPACRRDPLLAAVPVVKLEEAPGETKAAAIAWRAFLLLTLLLLADCLWLGYSGAWVGCTLSCGWCQGQGSILSAGPVRSQTELIRRTVVFVLVAPAALLNCLATRARYRTWHLTRPHGIQMGVWAFLSCLASLCCLGCGTVAMSCAALRDTGWQYVDWNDYVHDASLILLLLCQLCAFLSQWALHGRTFSCKATVLAISMVALSLSMLALVDHCPTLTSSYRVVVLGLECGALLCAQLLHVELCTETWLERLELDGSSSNRTSSRTSNRTSSSRGNGPAVSAGLPPLASFRNRCSAELAVFHSVSPMLAMEYHLCYHWHIPTHLNHLLFGTTYMMGAMLVAHSFLGAYASLVIVGANSAYAAALLREAAKHGQLLAPICLYWMLLVLLLLGLRQVECFLATATDQLHYTGALIMLASLLCQLLLGHFFFEKLQASADLAHGTLLAPILEWVALYHRLSARMALPEFAVLSSTLMAKAAAAQLTPSATSRSTTRSST